MGRGGVVAIFSGRGEGGGGNEASQIVLLSYCESVNSRPRSDRRRMTINV